MQLSPIRRPGMSMKHRLAIIAFTILAAGCAGDGAEAAPTVSDTTLAPATTPTSASGATPTQSTSAPTTSAETSVATDLTGSWAFGLTSVRTGEPLIAEGMEHHLDPAVVSYGYNLVVDSTGTTIEPRAVPLTGGEALVLTEDYQDDPNTREFSRVFSIMAPIRDTILYSYETTSRDEWLQITETLTVNGIKTEDAAVVDGRSVLSTGQVYDYIATGAAEGSPIARYLEEAGLELKCLAFVDFDFTNPEGANHCADHGLVQGSGITLP
jgi:hypothetical protein